MKVYALLAGLAAALILWAVVANSSAPRQSPSPAPAAAAVSVAPLRSKLLAMQERFSTLAKDPSLMLDAEWNAATTKLVRETQAEANELAAKWPEKRDALNKMAESLRVMAESLKDYDMIGMSSAARLFTRAADDLN